MKQSYNQKTGKYYSKLIRNVNVYLNENQEKVWNELPELYTNNQKIQHFINYYIINNKGGNDNE
ncbi:hypothetical protein [Spiroplasma endosymbiont of Glossina fuscipes fuscipes]|uniref:hypothetical protein n=1 Tax=Spiroplasma endosymbiont of Glossina fuscipes fuscipes TaxID=2004463 RepID=UPI003C73341D